MCSLVPKPVRAIRVTRGGLEPSEFSRQALQVKSHPKSPRTTGNEAGASVDWNQGHPKKSKYCREFSIAWGRQKTARWPFHSCTIFAAYLINCRNKDFLKFNFHLSLPRSGYVSKKKGNLKFRVQKSGGERNQKLLHFRNTSNCIYNFWEDNTQALVMSRRLKP